MENKGGEEGFKWVMERLGFPRAKMTCHVKELCLFSDSVGPAGLIESGADIRFVFQNILDGRKEKPLQCGELGTEDVEDEAMDDAFVLPNRRPFLCPCLSLFLSPFILFVWFYHVLLFI